MRRGRGARIQAIIGAWRLALVLTIHLTLARLPCLESASFGAFSMTCPSFLFFPSPAPAARRCAPAPTTHRLSWIYALVAIPRRATVVHAVARCPARACGEAPARPLPPGVPAPPGARRQRGYARRATRRARCASGTSVGERNAPVGGFSSVVRRSVDAVSRRPDAAGTGSPAAQHPTCLDCSNNWSNQIKISGRGFRIAALDPHGSNQAPGNRATPRTENLRFSPHPKAASV